MKKYEKSFVILVEKIPAENADPAGYLATNDELGLAVEADTLDTLVNKVCEVAPDLFELNVLPYLETETAKTPPAYIIQHAISSGDCGGDILS